MGIEKEVLENAKAWPFQQAKQILNRYKHQPPEKGFVLFETGYGPSGLPHIGTFGEVARTLMVKHAFEQLSDIPTKLYCFSDDMDGLRKVPTNVPNQHLLQDNLNKPLTQVPDPFEKYESFAHHNNAKLREFLDRFGFEYEFKSSTTCYQSGMFDEALLKMLKKYDAIMKIMLPTLGEERRKSYSPFMPICPQTGEVLQNGLIGHDAEKGTISFVDGKGDEQEVSVTGGTCKLQWKPDWGMRWHAFGVDYEMAGKDLIDSVKLANKICKTLGTPPPVAFNYELFLDDQGQKISKSKGNGLTIEDWLKYAPEESLSLFMYQKPQTAKRLFFDVIPKAVDEYLTFNKKISDQTAAEKVENPTWHIHSGNVPKHETALSFSLLLNLAAAANAEDKSVMWGFISKYVKDASPEGNPFLDHLTQYAVQYYQDFVKPNKAYRSADDRERKALTALSDYLTNLDKLPSSEDIQTQVYEIGKAFEFENLRDWFKACYEILLGQSQGPRLGSFIALYGKDEMIKLIEEKIR